MSPGCQGRARFQSEMRRLGLRAVPLALSVPRRLSDDSLASRPERLQLTGLARFSNLKEAVFRRLEDPYV
jgi:hypothetical protein